MQARVLMFVFTAVPLLAVAQKPRAKSAWLQNPDEAVAYVAANADFWLATRDTENGGFFTNVGNDGSVNPSRKAILTQARHAYSFSRAFMLTGNEEYLEAGRAALDFMYDAFWSDGGWKVEIDGSGAFTGHSANTQWIAFFQDMPLVGIIGMLEAARDPGDVDWMDRAMAHSERRWDSRPGFEGYYDRLDPETSEVAGKGFSATADALNHRIVPRVLLGVGSPTDERFVQLSDQVLQHFVGPLYVDDLSFGFPGGLNGDWEPEGTGQFVFSGHIYKSAWLLGQAAMRTGGRDYEVGMGALLDEIWNHQRPGHEAWDSENGGPFSVFKWIDGTRSDTNKSWWMLGDAFMGSMLGWYLSGEDRYWTMADESLDFFERHFVDAGDGGVFASTSKTGAPVSSMKGDFWKASFHEVELGYYAYLYGKLLYREEAIEVHYRVSEAESEQNLVLTPLMLPEGSLTLDGVTHNGEPWTSFDGATRTLTVPPGESGVFAAVFSFAVPKFVRIPVLRLRIEAETVTLFHTSDSDFRYLLESSNNLEQWGDEGDWRVGTNEELTYAVVPGEMERFYRVRVERIGNEGR